jgi:hypothetical protein
VKNVEHFLRQATRGLWGQHKRDALTELRGAVEDKVYRHRLAGLNETDATLAALQDLGSPHAIARDLNRVHTAPSALRAALLLGVAGVLGMQAAAQIPMIHAAPVPVTEACRFDEAKLARFSPEDRAMILGRISAAGGRANYEAACRTQHSTADPNQLLRLSDVISALRAGGIEVLSLPGVDTYLQLRLPGQDWQALNLTGSTEVMTSSPEVDTHSGDIYIHAVGLINQLRSPFRGALSLRGLVNPTLQIGPAQMQIGTAQRPVLATHLYSSAVMEEVEGLMRRAGGSAQVPRLQRSDEQARRPEYTKLTVNAQAGVYVLVGTSGGQVNLMVQALQNGQLELPCDCSSLPVELTGDLKTLLKWTQWEKTGWMVYAMQVGDLRHLNLTPVPAAQVKVVNQK